MVVFTSPYTSGLHKSKAKEITILRIGIGGLYGYAMQRVKLSTKSTRSRTLEVSVVPDNSTHYLRYLLSQRRSNFRIVRTAIGN